MNLRSLMPIGRDRNVARSDNPFMSLQRGVDRLYDDWSTLVKFQRTRVYVAAT